MPSAQIPLIPGQLVFIPTWGELSKDDLKVYDETFWAILEASSHTFVHGIYDYSGLNGMPPLAELTKLRVGKHPRVGWSVFTGVNNVIFKFFASMTVQFFGQRVRFLKTNAEALEFLKSVDGALPQDFTTDLDALTARTRAEAEAVR